MVRIEKYAEVNALVSDGVRSTTTQNQEAS